MADQTPHAGVARTDRHSRVVRVLRWLLPAIAVILLASIFVLSNANKVRQGLIIADSKLAELAVGQKITNPNFSGVTKSGDAFSISAEWALPDGPNPDQIELMKPRTTIDFEGGRSLKATAGSGLLDLRKSLAALEDDVDLLTANGYTARTGGLMLNFETGNASSDGTVSAVGPVGSIEAGQMELIQDLHLKPVGNAVLRFTGGVKLIYNPKRE